MKRTLKGIAAASIVLGMMTPAAFASTSSITWGKKNIQFQKYTANGVYGYAEEGTTYMPIWYVLQALKQSGYDYTYDGKVLNISTPSGVTPNTSGIDLGFGNLTIQINGTDVKKVITEVHKDPAGGKKAADTTYIPIYYIQQILKALHFHNTWDGTNWKGAQLSSVSVSAANSSVSVGQGDQVTFVLKDSEGNTVTPDNVSYSVTDANGNPTDGAAVSSHGVFTANQPGTYIVTVNADGVVGQATITVYGQAAAVKLSAASTSVVANGVTTTTITATVVDANGNTVTNYNGPLTVVGTATTTDANNNNAPAIKLANGGYVEGGTVSGTNTMTFNAVNGVAKITLAAGQASGGSSDVVSVGGTTPNGTTLQAGSVTINYVAPTPTAFKLVPATSTVSAGSSDTVNIQVLDQAGVPISSGIYNATVTVSGPATLSGNSQTQSLTFSGSGSVTVNTLNNASGSVTVTVTGTTYAGNTLQSASTTLNVGTPAAAAALKLSLPSTYTNQVDGKTYNLTNNTVPADALVSGGTLTISGTVVDANGFQTTSGAPSSVNYTVTKNGKTVDSGVANVTNGSFSITLTGTEDVAGTYTITATAPGLTNGTTTLTVTPGAYDHIAITPSVDTYVTQGNPTQTITVQAEDKANNPVAQAGLPINFYVSSYTPGTSPTLNGGANYTTAGAPLTVNTNSSGVATVTLGLPSTAGSYAQVTAYEGTVTGSPAVTQTTAKITVEGAVATSISAKLSQSTAYTAGTPVSNLLTIKPMDTYGDVMAGDVVEITIPQGALSGSPTFTKSDGTTVTPVATPSPGVYDVKVPDANGLYVSGTPGTAGSYNITVKDISSPQAPSTSVNLAVVKGQVAGFALFDASGNDLSSASVSNDKVGAGGYIALTLEPVDAAGNPVAADGTYTVNLPTAAANGEWRTNLSGTKVNQVTFNPGQTSVTLYYVNGDSSSHTIGSNGTPDINAAFGTGLTAMPSATAAASTIQIDGGSTTAFNGTISPVSAGKGSAHTITVHVANGSGALSGQTVYFNVSSGSGSLSATAVTTDANGNATVTYTAPANAGTATVTITVGGAAGSNKISNSVTFNIS